MAENLSTFDHAMRIVTYYVNEQYIRTVKYFKIALRENRDPQSLLNSIYEELRKDETDFIKFLSVIFSNIDKN